MRSHVGYERLSLIIEAQTCSPGPLKDRLRQLHTDAGKGRVVTILIEVILVKVTGIVVAIAILIQ